MTHILTFLYYYYCYYCFPDTAAVTENGSSPKPVPHPKLSPKVAQAEADYFPINMTSLPSVSPPPKEEKPHNDRKRRASTDSAEVKMILSYQGNVWHVQPSSRAAYANRVINVVTT